MARERRFPVFEHMMWTNCLENLPHISEDTVTDFTNQVPTSSKQLTRSYAFAVEAYTLPSSVFTNACDTRYVSDVFLWNFLKACSAFPFEAAHKSCRRCQRRAGVLSVVGHVSACFFQHACSRAWRTCHYSSTFMFSTSGHQA